ncbi:MAG: PP2C family protein-serine/threonine phosphatase [Terracidiphilus sp.]|jgi:hypothetical protein
MRPGFAVAAGLFVAFLLVWPAIGPAQGPPANPQQTVPLSVGGPVDLATAAWRTFCGDNAAWADPAFDDGAWLKVDPRAPLPAEATPTPERICWYRAEITVDPALKNLGLSIDRTALADYELFVNGKSEGVVGEFHPHGKRSIRMMGVYPLSAPIPSTGELTIALRLWRYARFSPTTALPGLPFVARLGFVPDLNLTTQNLILLQLAYGLVGGPAIGLLVGTLALGLFVGQRERKEYLWLGIYGISFVCAASVSIFAYSHTVSAIWSEAIVLVFQNLILVAFIEFFLAFLGRRPGLWIRLYEGCFAIPILIGEIGTAGKGDVYLGYFIPNILFVPGTVMLGIFLFIEYKRRNREAAILIVPTLLAVGTYDLFTVLNLLGMMHVNVAWLLSVLTFKIGFLPSSVYAVCLPLFWISMGVIILRRSARDTREKARLAGEFDAARTVQQLLISKEGAAAAEFNIESIYLPASEVGGDFYQLLPGDDGSLLVVVGDVSGKGLRAAMTVSLIVGALRGTELRGCGLREVGSRSPGQVLAYLNGVLAGQISGFVTCCAAHISADGILTLANAGHIPPYRNGEEVFAESGLPLGILSGMTYGESQFQLRPEDRLTFVSDGVIEATNPQKELFGFERTRAISTRPAYHIAEAARSFGQEDDITVLTISRAAMPALKPASV